jgi:hypothetical protein
MEAAQVAGRAVEDLSQRSETEQVFAEPDGTWTSSSSLTPERVKEADGSWKDIDTTLEARDGGLMPKVAIGDLQISNGGDKSLASMSVDGRDLAWSWPTVLPKPFVHGNQATYPDVVPNGDLVVTATPSGFQHDLVLRQAPTSPLVLKTPVVTDGTILSEGADGELRMSTKSGEDLVGAPNPVMYDASTDPAGQSDNVADLDTAVTPSADGAVVTLRPDQAFLTDPATEYPVTIDPSYNVLQYSNGDTWVSTSGPNAIHPNDDTLVVGTPNGGTYKYRALLRFGTGAWDNAQISSATLRVRNFDAKTCSGSTIYATRIIESWMPGSATWNDQPAITTSGRDGSAVAKGYSGSCPAADVDWDATAITQAWANGSTNYGIRLAAADESLNSGYREYRSAGYTTADGSTALRPRLIVNYNHYPNTATTLAVSSLSGGSLSTARPVISAHVSDKDGAPVYERVEIYQGTSTSATYTGIGSKVTAATGGTSTLTVPAGVLSDGVSYTIKVYSWDGQFKSGSNGASGGYAGTTFTVHLPSDEDPATGTDPNDPAMTSYGVDEYELEDLQRVAAQDGTTVDEELDQFGWQDAFSDDVATIEAAYPETFASAEIPDSGTADATVKFTDAVPTDAASYFDDLPSGLDVDISAGAAYSAATQDQMVSDAADALSDQLSDDANFTVEYNETTQRLEADLYDPAPTPPSTTTLSARVRQTLSATTAPAVSVPGVDLSYSDEPVVETSTLQGGVTLSSAAGSSCTTGFPAQVRGTSTYGIITARHCDNDMDYYSTPSRYVLNDANRFLSWAKGDIQFHQTRGEGVGHSFYYAVGKKRKIGRVDHPVLGMRVCAFGRVSRNASVCSTVGSLHNAIQYSKAEQPRNMILTRTSMKTIPGDSGGPAFWGGHAIALISGSKNYAGGSQTILSPVDATVNDSSFNVMVNVP